MPSFFPYSPTPSHNDAIFARPAEQGQANLSAFAPTPSPRIAAVEAPLTPPATFPRKNGKSSKMIRDRTLKQDVPKGPVNFAPHDDLPEHLKRQLAEMDFYPSDGVARYPRTIPYKGQKSTFWEKTGRPGFDVFEYRFTAEDEEGEKKRWWVMWDYFNGLVRIHDIFDCCRPGKTEPGNAVRDRVNPGLHDICHNITGGNLHAQGYWVPFKAAEALLAKFAYRVRFGLTVIFGKDFPDLCIPPGHDDYGQYSIAPEIIAECREEAQRYREEALRQTECEQRTENTPLLSRPGSQTPEGSRPSTSNSGRSFYDAVRGVYTTKHSSELSPTSTLPRILSYDRSRPVPQAPPYGGVMPREAMIPAHTPSGQQTPVCVRPAEHAQEELLSRPSPPGFSVSVERRTASRTVTPGLGSPYASPSRRPAASGISRDDDLAETHPSAKRRKISDGPSQLYQNPLAKKVEHGIETFGNMPNTGRAIPSLPPPRKYLLTSSRFRQEQERQKADDPVQLQQMEAAGTLISLAFEDHELHYRSPRGRRHHSAHF